MKIAIVGSRNFSDYKTLKEFILENMNIEDISLVVSGGASGADSLGERFAKEFKIDKLIFYPDWDKHGKSAGFIRNKDIVRTANVVFAFWDGSSKGTRNTLALSEEMNKIIYLYNF